MKRVAAFFLILWSLGLAAQGSRENGIWLLKKTAPVEKRGLTEGGAFVFSRPVGTLPAGSFVQFGVSLENGGEKAPLHYLVEFYDGGRWVSDPDFVYNDGLSEYSFFTVSSSVRQPSIYMAIYRLRNDVSDTLKVRCRVCSNYAADGSVLDADSPENVCALKNRKYVGAYLQPLGSTPPSEIHSVLLVGNSFTYYFGEPFLLQEIAFSQGVQLNMRASLKGGQYFRQHCGLEMTRRTIEQGGYDYAFIQGQSQEPAQYAADVSTHQDTEDAFVELCKMVRSASPDCMLFVENTWGYPAKENGGFASLEEFDRLLEEGCRLLAEAGACDRTLVGQAFVAARENTDLLDTDVKHPSLAGVYLKACITCLTITGRPFSGTVPNCGLPEEEAAYLRSVAEKLYRN